MTQRLLRFGHAQCFQSLAQLLLDLRGEEYLVRRGTLCENRTRERHCGEEECEESNVLHNSRNHSHYTRYVSSSVHALHLAGPQTLVSGAPVCTYSHTHFF